MKLIESIKNTWKKCACHAFTFIFLAPLMPHFLSIACQLWYSPYQQNGPINKEKWLEEAAASHISLASDKTHFYNLITDFNKFVGNNITSVLSLPAS